MLNDLWGYISDQDLKLLQYLRVVIVALRCLHFYLFIYLSTNSFFRLFIYLFAIRYQSGRIYKSMRT